MVRKCNLYRLLRYFIPRNDEFDEPYIERASPQSLDVKLWRIYRCDSDSWRLLVRAIIPTAVGIQYW